MVASQLVHSGPVEVWVHGQGLGIEHREPLGLYLLQPDLQRLVCPSALRLAQLRAGHRNQQRIGEARRPGPEPLARAQQHQRHERQSDDHVDRLHARRPGAHGVQQTPHPRQRPLSGRGDGTGALGLLLGPSQQQAHRNADQQEDQDADEAGARQVQVFTEDVDDIDGYVGEPCVHQQDLDDASLAEFAEKSVGLGHPRRRLRNRRLFANHRPFSRWPLQRRRPLVFARTDAIDQRSDLGERLQVVLPLKPRRVPLELLDRLGSVARYTQQLDQLPLRLVVQRIVRHPAPGDSQRRLEIAASARFLQQLLVRTPLQPLEPRSLRLQPGLEPRCVQVKARQESASVDGQGVGPTVLVDRGLKV